jgi:hypothetical protein
LFDKDLVMGYPRATIQNHGQPMESSPLYFFSKCSLIDSKIGEIVLENILPMLGSQWLKF